VCTLYNTQLEGGRRKEERKKESKERKTPIEITRSNYITREFIYGWQ
jgi:hypothetical protein